MISKISKIYSAIGAFRLWEQAIIRQDTNTKKRSTQIINLIALVKIKSCSRYKDKTIIMGI